MEYLVKYIHNPKDQYALIKYYFKLSPNITAIKEGESQNISTNIERDYYAMRYLSSIIDVIIEDGKVTNIESITYMELLLIIIFII